MSAKQFLYDTEKNDDLVERQYATNRNIKSKKSNSLNPEELIKFWNILLKASVQILKAATHQCIRTTNILDRSLKYNIPKLDKFFGIQGVRLLTFNITVCSILPFY